MTNRDSPEMLLDLLDQVRFRIGTPRRGVGWGGRTLLNTAEFLNEPEKDQKRIVETVTVPAGTLREAAHMLQETRT